VLSDLSEGWYTSGMKIGSDRRQAWRGACLGAAVVCVCASPALANPSVAFAVPALLMAVVGNLVIGVVEWIGLVMLGAHRWRAAVMIPANYVSWIAGWMLLASFSFEPLIGGIGLFENIVWFSVAAMALLTIMGVVVELPFVAMAFRGPRNHRRILRASIVVNVVTGACVGVYFTQMSNLSLVGFKGASPTAVAKDVACDDAWVRFRLEGKLWQMRPDGSGRVQIEEPPKVDDPWLDPEQRMQYEWMLDLREPGSGEWTVRNVIGRGALEITRGTDVEFLQLLHPMLGASTAISYPSVLPGDVVVFELGDFEGEIRRGVYAISLRSRTAADLGPGTKPFAVRSSSGRAER
jgi:hypothetical protein